MKNISVSLFLIVIFILAGCSVLGSPPDPKTNPLPTNTPLRWYPRPATATPIPTVTEPAQIPMTGGLFAPPISVNVATNCRRGPSADYDVLLAFLPGQNGIVLGKYDPSNYYYIRTDTGYTCWVWGQNVTIDGSTNNIPDMPPPPFPTSTPTPRPPIQSQYNPPATSGPAVTAAPTNVQNEPPKPPPPEPKPTKDPKPPKPPKCKWLFCSGDGGGGGAGGKGHGPGGMSPILVSMLIMI